MMTEMGESESALNNSLMKTVSLTAYVTGIKGRGENGEEERKGMFTSSSAKRPFPSSASNAQYILLRQSTHGDVARIVVCNSLAWYERQLYELFLHKNELFI